MPFFATSHIAGIGDGSDAWHVPAGAITRRGRADGCHYSLPPRARIVEAVRDGVAAGDRVPESVQPPSPREDPGARQTWSFGQRVLYAAIVPALAAWWWHDPHGFLLGGSIALMSA